MLKLREVFHVFIWHTFTSGKQTVDRNWQQNNAATYLDNFSLYTSWRCICSAALGLKSSDTSRLPSLYFQEINNGFTRSRHRQPRGEGCRGNPLGHAEFFANQSQRQCIKLVRGGPSVLPLPAGVPGPGPTILQGRRSLVFVSGLSQNEEALQTRQGGYTSSYVYYMKY